MEEKRSLPFFFIEDTREIWEMELFYSSIYSAGTHCRWSRGRDLQSHNVSTESYVLCNSTSSLNIKIFQIWRESSQRIMALNCLHKWKNKKYIRQSLFLVRSAISIFSLLHPLSRNQLWLYFQSRDSWVCLSMCVRVGVCVCGLLRQEICGNVVIKEMMRNMLMGPPGLSKHINNATVRSWCAAGLVPLLWQTHIGLNTKKDASTHSHIFTPFYSAFCCQYNRCNSSEKKDRKRERKL